MLIEKITFPENNGSCILQKHYNNVNLQSVITIKYEFNSLNNKHLFTIENEGFVIENVIGVVGSVLNIQGLNVCKIFVVLHSPLMNDLLGYQKELPAQSTLMYLLDREALDIYINNIDFFDKIHE